MSQQEPIGSNRGANIFIYIWLCPFKSVTISVKFYVRGKAFVIGCVLHPKLNFGLLVSKFEIGQFRQFQVLVIDLQSCEFAFKQSCTMAQRTEGTLFCNKQNGHLASCFCHPLRNFAFQLRCMDHFHFENHVRLTIGAPHRIVQTCVMFETF